jgi:HPt (histidine-containing phosphotransfer) domain-containing protein
MFETHQFSPILDKEFLIENYDTLEYLLEIFGDFLALMPEEIEEIKAAQAEKDKDSVVRKMHAISSAVGFVGGTDLSDRMKKFEVKAKTDPGFDINSEDSNALVNEIDEFIGIIQEEYNQLS